MTSDAAVAAPDRRASWTNDLRHAVALFTRPPARWVIGAVVVMVGSIRAGPDANWDLLNYHYMNGRALVTGSLLGDVAPAGIQSYLHPLVDAPIHVFVELFGSWWGLVLWAGLLQWLALIPVWRLTGVFPGVAGSVVRRGVAFAVVVTAAGAGSLAFTTFGDWVVAALLCEALTRALRCVGDESGEARHEMVLAGVFIGLAATVKLTSLTFAVALTLGVLATSGLRVAARLVGGAALSFVALAGPWMVYLWVRFHNPVFPFYNGIFRSESAPATNFDDARFGARSVLDVVTIPFALARGTHRYTEGQLRDWRAAALLVAVVVVLAVVGPARMRAWATAPAARVIAAFVTIGTVLWAVQFGIYRYALPAEIVVSIALVGVVAPLVRRPVVLAATAAVALPLGSLVETEPFWGRGDALDQPELRAAIDALPVAPGHLVLVGPAPISYLVASFDSDVNVASLVGFRSTELLRDGPLADDLDAFVRDGLEAGDLVVIVAAGERDVPAPLDALALGTCRPFRLFDEPMRICTVEA